MTLVRRNLLLSLAVLFGIAWLCASATVALCAQAPAAVEQQPLEPDPEALPEIRTARDLFQLYGADEERLHSLVDGSDVTEAELLTLLRSLKASQRFTTGQLIKYQQTKLPWTEWAKQPNPLRGELYDFRAEIKSVTRLAVPEQLVERYELSGYYRCEVVLAPENEAAVIYTLTIPNAWAIDKPLNLRGGARGFFLKLGGTPPEMLQPVFVAQRIAWYPPTPLGDLGMDVGLFDTVNNPKFERKTPTGPAKLIEAAPLRAEERDCFFELLAAVGRASQRELMQLTRDSSPQQDRYPLEPLFNRPDTQHGELLALTGTAQRAVKIRVESPDLIATYGFDHYYELEIVTGQSQGNPLTFCVLSLPPGMRTGEEIQVDVRIPGFFFKTWTYRLPIKGKDLLQAAPMIVGREPYLLPKPKVDTSFSTIIATILVGSLLLMLAGVWWLGRSDKRFGREVIQSRVNVPPKGSFDHLRHEDNGPTNLSNRD